MNKPDKLMIVIHEIYGVNKHIKIYCNHLSTLGYEVFCPNLLQKEPSPFSYEQEEKAYQHFMKEIGFLKARDKIIKTVEENRKKYKNIYLVGFSVWATIAWLCSEQEGVDGIVGYYGSRIRDYTKIKPPCPALLFFSDEEKGFHIDNLILNLIDKNVEVHKFEGKHGFSDPFSTKYNQSSGEEAFRMVVHFLKGLERKD